MAKVNLAELFRLWHLPVDEMPTVEIAKVLKIGVSTVYSMARSHGLRKREKSIEPTHDRDPRDPTPEQILEMAKEIRQSWPPGEAEHRMVGKRMQHWQLPSYSFDGRECSFSGTALDL